MGTEAAVVTGEIARRLAVARAQISTRSVPLGRVS